MRKDISIDRIPFEREAVKKKLDECIEEWKSHPRAWADVYCDAFSYMKFLLFGHEEEKEEKIDDIWEDQEWYNEKL